MNRKNRPLRNPFVTTVATTIASAALAAATMGAGCGGTVTFVCDGDDCPEATTGTGTGSGSSGSGSTGSGNPSTCPQTTPESGGSCSPVGLACEYNLGDNGCGIEDKNLATCTPEGWSVVWQGSSCNPPPPECPEVQPFNGDPCFDANAWCTYFDEFCGVDINASCNGSTWEVDQIECNPPAPVDCYDVPDEMSCEASRGCVWHHPACTDLGPAIEGCFPEGECTLGSCPGDRMCVSVEVDPCADAFCNTCSEPIDLCIFPLGG